MSSHRRDIAQLIKRLEKQGWQAIKRPCGHWWLVAPSGVRVPCPATPSDHRSIKNVRAHLRREGAVL